LAAEYRAISARCPDGFVAWVVVEEGVKAPDEKTRLAITRAMDDVADHILASLATLEASGFMAAAARGALTAMSLILRSSFPRKFFGTVQESAAWCTPWVRDPKGRPVTQSILLSQLARFRSSVS
jgi:hypothetical protein